MRIMATIAREQLEEAVRKLGGDLSWPDSVKPPASLDLQSEIDEADAWEKLSQFVDLPRAQFDLRDLGDFCSASASGDFVTALSLAPRLFAFVGEQEIVEASIRAGSRR